MNTTQNVSSSGPSQTATRPQPSRHPKLNVNDAQFNMHSINYEKLGRLDREISHTVVDWLQLCNIIRTQQPSSPQEDKQFKLFKDAIDINTTSLDLSVAPKKVEDPDNSDFE